MFMRKIAVVTGTRAEYGILQSLLQKTHEDPGLELQLYVSGMHLSDEYGKTINEIPYPITAKIDMHIKDKNEANDMAHSVSYGINGFVEAFEKNKPDVVVIVGDRIEPFAAAIATMFLRIPLAHIHGGDVSPNVFDDRMRHALTKMASIHFPVSDKSMNRIIKMGEEGWRIHNVGAPQLDTVLNIKTLSKEELFKKYGLDAGKKTIMVLYHPTTTEWEKAGEQFSSVIDTLVQFDDCQKLIIYPNADAGGYKIIEEIKKLEDKADYFVFKNLPYAEYISVMKNSDVLVGNSTSSIVEAPSLALPAVNVGLRQECRERANNVIDVPHNPKEIKKAIERALHDEEFLKLVAKRETPYGDGHAAEKIISVLKNVEINDKLIKKRMTY